MEVSLAVIVSVKVTYSGLFVPECPPPEAVVHPSFFLFAE